MLLSQLEYVAEVARTKSFNKAAKNLYLTQSALSIAVRNLEKELHLTIFVRSNQGVRLTPEGEEALTIINTILNNTRKLGQLSTKLSSEEIFLVCPVFHKLYSFILSNYHDAKFSINEASSPEIFEKVSSGIVPMGIGSFATPFFESLSLKKSVTVFPLFQDDFYLVMSQNNSLKNRSNICPDDLAGSTLSVFSNQTPSSDYSYWIGYPNDFSAVHSYHHISSLIENIKHISSISILSGSAIEAYDLQTDPDIVIREITSFKNQFHYVLLMYSGLVADSDESRKFIQFRQHIQSYFS